MAQKGTNKRERRFFFMVNYGDNANGIKMALLRDKANEVLSHLRHLGPRRHFSAECLFMTNKVNYSGSSVARKNAASFTGWTKRDASSSRQRPDTFSQVAKPPLSLSRNPELPCHGPVRRRINSPICIPYVSRSRRPTRGFHHSRRCPNPVVVASGRCRRRCG